MVQLGAAQFLCLMGVCAWGWRRRAVLLHEVTQPRGCGAAQPGWYQGCFPSSSAVLLQGSGNVKEA